MKAIKTKLKSISGASLIEVLIGLFLAGLVTAAVFEAYINQHKSWSIQEDVAEIQQNARASIDELTRNIRMAGHELPLGLPAIEAYDTNPDTIVINYVDNGCQANIVHPMPKPSAELRCDGQDVSCFYDGQWAYIFEPDSGGGEFFEITQVQIAAAHIQHNTMVLSKAYSDNAILLSLQRMKYFIDNSDTAHPNLMLVLPGRAPEVYAENVSDLQFRYRMKNGMVVNVPAIVQDIREIEILVEARSDKPDPDFPHDPYRERVYSSKVNMRNLDM
jgi:hypothetical protein